MYGFPAAGSGPAIAAAGPAAPGPRVRGPGVPPADAVTREGGVAATPLQSQTRPSAEQKRGQAVSMRHRIAIGPNRQASLQMQNYNVESRCRSMATSRESRVRMPFSAYVCAYVMHSFRQKSETL